MITIIIKGADGEETGRGKLPESWEEVTVRNYIGIQTIKNDSELLANIANIPVNVIENTRSDLTNVFKVLARYLTKRPESFENIRGHEIDIEGKTINFPKSLEFTTFGQSSILRNLLEDNSEDLEKIVPDVFALYLQPIVDGTFDRSRLPHFKEIVLDLPIVQVRPHVLFFLRNLKRLKVNLSLGLMR